MERTKGTIKLAGYKPLPLLIELTRDALRAMDKSERQVSCKILIREILKWSSYSPEEALGILQSAQFYFMQQAEDIIEQDEEVNGKWKRACKRIT